MTYNSDMPKQGQVAEDARKAGDLLQLEIAGVRVNFRWAPAGTFVMGSPKREWGHWSGETQHEVKLTQGFWICETQTPQELWVAVTRNNPSRFKDSNQLPVENVSWYDCLAFIEVLNRIHASALPVGYKFTLPTEAQWEYACRAGTTTRFNFGDDFDGSEANWDGCDAYDGDESMSSGRTMSVKSFSPNAWGLYNMHGNVSEWCVDWYDSDYYASSSAKIDPTGPESGSERVRRGGDMWSRAVYSRCAYRDSAEPDNSGGYIGLRLVLGRSNLLSMDLNEAFERLFMSGEDELSEPQREYPNGDEPEATREPGALTTLEIAGVQVNFHWAPAGTFLMGSPESEDGHTSEEAQREVTLTQGFWIAETPTTQELWEAVMKKNPSEFNNSPRLPVEQVSWNACQKFVDLLNRVCRSALPSGYEYFMPTEAQWEYACRAGTTTPFNFGDSSYGDKANFDGRFPYRTSAKSKYKARTTPVKRFAPNAWGLYDMHGNVWEWCENSVIEYDTSSEEQMALIKQERSSDLVQRGGSWSYAPEYCRSAYRRLVAPTDEGADFGFRLVLAPGTRYQHIDAETEAVRQYQQIVQESENRVYPCGDEPEATREAGAITTLEIAGIPVNFHWAPAGTFLMGSPESEAWRRQDEMQHEVTLTKGFWIAETLTTWKLWEAACGVAFGPEWSNSTPRWELNWNDCQDFVDKLNTDFSDALPSGYKYAMPTEAQWEYACRAGTTTPFNFGSVLVGDCQAHFAYNYPIMDIEVYNIGAVPVKSYAPNAWGLYEMHGNLCEWCADWYDRDYYASSSAKVDPTGPDTGDRRVLRGGCRVGDWWLSRIYDPRSAARQNDVPDSRVFSFYFGFRLVLVR